ncbi:MAG TPA: hypothetical protein QF873_03210, partial [Patescibacteria group bacterium]|nr:hypothetical protein [Patescibacteria group bacterium]
MSFVLQLGRFLIHVHPNEQWSREEFMRSTPHGSIALDGMVKGGPFYDEATKRLNLDHHDGVKREATMSTCMQMFFALKGDMMDAFTGIVHVYINDIDQDVALAVWQLVNYALFEGTKDVPSISRLRTLTDRIDITSCACPMKLSDRLNRQHSWVFGAYQSFRSSGEMASASASSLAANLEATLARLDSFLMNNGEERELNVDHVILYDGSGFKVIDERGCGN